MDKFLSKQTKSQTTTMDTQSQKQLITTEKSFLSKMVITDPAIIQVISSCVSEIKNSLHIRPPIKVFNRECRQARDVGFFSNFSIGYHYSRQLMPPKPLTNNMEDLLLFINKTYKAEFNAILINRYNDGTENIGAHSDDEKNLDKSGVVALSWGATRKFRIRDKKTKTIHIDIPLNHLSIVHMGGEFQKEFTHEIPVEKKVKEPRISFTFRRHLI